MVTHFAVFLITLSGLILEVGLTRIYSATIWYHFAFIAISIALLGWGLGGFVLHLFRRRLFPTAEKAAVLTLLYAATIPLCLALIVKFPFRLEVLALYFIAPLLPFFLAGIALSMIFQMRRETAATLYFADLTGASLGALAVTFLLEKFGSETTLLLATAAALFAAALLSRRTRIIAVAGLVVSVGVAMSNEEAALLRVTPGSLKAMKFHMDQTPGTRVTQTGWNAYSRIDAVEGFPPPNLARLYIDSDAWTNVQAWNGDIESIRNMRGWYRALPFRLVPEPETLVIGPGGGADVVVALGSGSRKVTAVELNPLMIEFVRNYGARAGNLYDRPDVEVVQSEGRNFISRTDRKFDVIFLGFVDTWASVASGGLSLSENYLYTTEALRAYYEHLSDDGVLAIMRWKVDIPRLVSNSVALLGVEEASKRVVALMENRAERKRDSAQPQEKTPDDPAQMIFLLRKRPFTEAETVEIMDWTIANPVIVPGRHAEAPYDDLFSGRKTPAQIIAESPRRVDPVFDDSPFYFATERPWGLPYTMREGLNALLYPVLGLLAFFAVFGKPRGKPVAPYAASIVYFAALGAGFIAVELTLLQSLTLLLGHPIFTLSILLFTILAAGGIGSALSNRVPTRAACLAVAGLSITAAFALPRLVPALLAFELSARVAIAIAMILPFGLVMGMPFPQGLRHTGQGSLPEPPFYWGFNGVMSVIGSIGTVIVAVVFGFQVAMVAGGTCYILAAVAAPVMDPERAWGDRPGVRRPRSGVPPRSASATARSLNH
jgi:predicted membrane-bound spermidine synthase